MKIVKKDLNYLKGLKVSVDCYDCFENPTLEQSFNLSCLRGFSKEIQKTRVTAYKQSVVKMPKIQHTPKLIQKEVIKEAQDKSEDNEAIKMKKVTNSFE